MSGKRCLVLLLTSWFCMAMPPSVSADLPFEINPLKIFRLEMSGDSPHGDSSLREHAVVWHPLKKKYYLIADVIPLKSRHHPNTYETELHLWSSTDLESWAWHGVVVEKGNRPDAYDQHGVASPAGIAFLNGKIYVPFSARKTTKFTQRGIGLAVSGTDPEKIPWTKSDRAVSDPEGEDDDPAVLVLPNSGDLHLFHRNAGPDGYRIVHTVSSSPLEEASWSSHQQVALAPEGVRAQELTGVYFQEDYIHLFIIEHLIKGGTKIAFLKSREPEGPYSPVQSGERYLKPTSQPASLAYSGHITPVVREQKLTAFFWTVPQAGKRYGLQGHPLKIASP